MPMLEHTCTQTHKHTLINVFFKVCFVTGSLYVTLAGQQLTDSPLLGLKVWTRFFKSF